MLSCFICLSNIFIVFHETKATLTFSCTQRDNGHKIYINTGGRGLDANVVWYINKLGYINNKRGWIALNFDCHKIVKTCLPLYINYVITGQCKPDRVTQSNKTDFVDGVQLAQHKKPFCMVDYNHYFRFHGLFRQV